MVSVYCHVIIVMHLTAASWMYVYTGGSVQTCELTSETHPVIMYRNECFVISISASDLTWIKLFMSRPDIRSLIVMFEGQNISCSPASGTSVLARYQDGRYGTCVSQRDQDMTEKPRCTYRCRCVKHCTYVTIKTRSTYQQEICNVSYTMT